ncbi:MAG: hypothetical protein QOI99_262 [Actinomycetota bacterium]|nr:hypothetical protein [Actinomycetota bacterium]
MPRGSYSNSRDASSHVAPALAAPATAAAVNPKFV